MGCVSCDNGLFPGKSTKKIKFTSNGIGSCQLVVTEGANVVAKLDTCKWESDYEQFFTTSMFLPSGKQDMPIEYGSLGTQITFIAIIVTYEQVSKTPFPQQESEIPYLTYEFETNPGVDRPINKIFIHSGTEEHRIPKIFLSNPNTRWNARVNILASTEDLTFDEVTTTPVGDDVLTIDNLEYNFLSSTSQGLSILTGVNGDTVVFIVWINISNIELNGKIITIDDSAIGKINLGFKTEFDSTQAFSLILWALNDTATNIINNPAVDVTPPVITYNSSFTTEILLDDYPANGTNGDDGYLLTKEDLIALQINSVNDNRDGLIYLDSNNISLSSIEDVTPLDAISEIGKYNFTIDVSDNAKNTTSDGFILNVKDDLPPQIILNTIAQNIIIDNGTSGTNFLQQTPIYLEDYTNDILSKQEIIDLFIDTIWDARDGTILKHTNNVDVVINEINNNVLLSEISGIGNYEIRFNVEDSDSNIGSEFYSTINIPLGVDFIRVVISENQAPVVIFNEYTPLFLTDYPGQEITKSILNTVSIDEVTDDRDGIIITDVLNIQIFQTGISSSAGTNSVFVEYSTSGTNGEWFEPVTETELIKIDTKGLYKIRVNVSDSDSASTTSDDNFTVFD